MKTIFPPDVLVLHPSVLGSVFNVDRVKLEALKCPIQDFTAYDFAVLLANFEGNHWRLTE